MVREEETVRRGDTAVWPSSLTAGIVPAEFRQLTGCLSHTNNTNTNINTKTNTKTNINTNTKTNTNTNLSILRWAERKSILLASRMSVIDKSLLPRENLA